MIDLNSLRTEYLLRLEQGNRSTANSVGVRNRMPQGQLVPFSIADTVYFDEATPSITAFYIPDRVNVVIECKVAIDFDEYTMPVSAAASGGGATSGSSSAASSASGGSSTPTSGASSASSADSSGTLTSASGGASTSGGEGAHWHYAFEFAGDSPIGSRTAHNYSTYGSAAGVNLETGASCHDILTGAPAADHTHSTPNHSHTVAGHDHGIAHTHVVTIGGHDHGIAHTHSTPDHSHSLVLAATKEAYPDSHSATIKVFKLNGGTWDLIGGVWAMTDDAPELDLTAYVDGPGRWRFTLQSDASQPNSGRLGAHISGYVLGGIQSA